MDQIQPQDISLFGLHSGVLFCFSLISGSVENEMISHNSKCPNLVENSEDLATLGKISP